MRLHTRVVQLVFLATLLVWVGASGPALRAAPQHSQAQRQDFGYATRIYPSYLNDTELARVLDLASSAGINTIDFEASWARLDQGDSGGRKRTYDWQQADRLVSAAEERGMKVTFLLTGTPDWVHPHLRETVPNRADRIWYPPKGDKELQHWSDFVSDVVGRYGGRVSEFQVWNEPNLIDFWKPAPEVDEYAPLLRAAYLSAKDTNPHAKIVFGGLSKNDLGYLSEYYRVVKASYPDAASDSYFFDVLGVHPYSADYSPDRYTQDAIHQGKYGEVDGNYLGFFRMKELMEDQGDLGKDLFLSEYGFSTTDTWMNAVPDARRALYLKRAYESAREVPYVEGLSWYAFHHHPEWAIVDENLEPSLTFRAYKQVTGAEASIGKLRISLPEFIYGATYPIEPQLTNIRGSDVSHWELYIDGTLVEEQSTAPIIWHIQDAEVGAHTVMLAVYTPDGSVWHSNIAQTEVISISAISRQVWHLVERVTSLLFATLTRWLECIAISSARRYDCPLWDSVAI
jgi:hypothetical protein